MLDVSIASHARAAAKTLCRGQSGQYRGDLLPSRWCPSSPSWARAIGLQAVPIARARPMQSALDSTALMISKDLTDGRISTSDIEGKGEKAISRRSIPNKGLDRRPATNIHVAYLPKDSTTGMSNVGHQRIRICNRGLHEKSPEFPQLNFNTGATATWGKLPVCAWRWYWDNTGSMADNNKMPAMQKAGHGHDHGRCPAYNKQDGDVYISIIPFSKDVNVWDHQRPTHPGSIGRNGEAEPLIPHTRSA